MTFSQRAVLAAVMVGATAPLVGTFLVRRGMALVGDGLGHLAFAGVAIAPLIGVSPLPVALVVALAGAAVVEIVRWKSAGRSDLAIAFVFYASIALAVVVLAAGKRYNSRVLGVLFGSLLTVSNWELVTMALVLFAATLVTVFFLSAPGNDFDRRRACPGLGCISPPLWNADFPFHGSSGRSRNASCGDLANLSSPRPTGCNRTERRVRLCQNPGSCLAAGRIDSCSRHSGSAQSRCTPRSRHRSPGFGALPL